MSGDLDLIRAFRADDAAVDASSQNQARAALLEHIDRSATGKQGASRRWPRRRIAVLGIRADMVALALSILVVVGVGAAILRVGNKPSSRAAHQGVVEPRGPLAAHSTRRARRDPCSHDRRDGALLLTLARV